MTPRNMMVRGMGISDRTRALTMCSSKAAMLVMCLCAMARIRAVRRTVGAQIPRIAWTTAKMNVRR